MDFIIILWSYEVVCNVYNVENVLLQSNRTEQKEKCKIETMNSSTPIRTLLIRILDTSNINTTCSDVL